MRQESDRLHQRVSQLLPWYANGTLAAGERRTVLDHLASCALCRDEAEVCLATGTALRAAQEAAPSPHPAQLNRLVARIQEEESAGRPGLRRFAASVARLFQATPRPVQGLLAAQFALLALATGFLWNLHTRAADATAAPRPQAALFRTLSEAPAPPLPSVQIRLVFAEGATERQVRELLLSVRAQVVGGPSPLGAYTVEVPKAGSAADPLDSVLKHLRSQPQVRFAEKVERGR